MTAYTSTVFESAKELVRRVVGHWIQALAGTAMALLALVAEIRDWDVPANVWLTSSAVMFLWAILRAFHGVRLERDHAIEDAAEKRNVRKIIDTLTARYNFGVHELSHLAPPTGDERDHTFRQEFKEWNEGVKTWNDTVFKEMEELGCSPSEISRFWTIDELKPGMMIRGDQWEVAVRLHQTRCKRLWSIIEMYEEKAERQARKRSGSDS